MLLVCKGVSLEGDRILKREYRLKKRQDFRRAFQAGQSYANRQFVVVLYKREEEGVPRIGVSVSRKVGKAVVRNRIRRYVKEVLRHWIPQLKTGVDYVVIARMPVAKMDFHQVRGSLLHLFKRARCFKGKPPVL